MIVSKVLQRKLARVFLTTVATLFSFVVFADSQGLYVGTLIGLEEAKAKYTKSVIDSLDIIDVSTDDQGYSSESNSDGNQFNYGGLIGYRFDLNEDQLFMAIQAEVALTGSELDGILPGSGDDDGLNERGESWKEDFSLETLSDVGVIVKVGIVQRFLSVVDVSIYALGGLRRTKIEVATEFSGCVDDIDCAEDLEESFTTSESPQLLRWTLGVGVEKTIGSKTALQIEMRYTGSEREKWNLEGFEDLVIPYSLERTSYDFSANLVRYIF